MLTKSSDRKMERKVNSFVASAIEKGTTTTTENGDKTFSTSLNACVDLFFQIGAMRGQNKDRLLMLFSAAYAENPDVATRILLWARDVRGGAGERQIFRDILAYLEKHDHDRIARILHLIPEVGRWDDLFGLIGVSKATDIQVINFFWEAVVNGNGLAAKWAPRMGKAKSDIARLFRRVLDLDPVEYRRTIAKATKVVETQMCDREWGEINYEHVPSVASARYGKAFGRHDNERYVKYLESVKKGEKKINTKAAYPYDVLKAGVDDKVADVMWNNLPDYVREGQSFLPVIDVSGSMTSRVPKTTITAMDVAVSLGLYLAERNKSAFERLMVTFSSDPEIKMIPKGTVRQKVNFIMRAPWGMSTDLDKAMQLILDVATEGNVPADDMPKNLLILSDMEFNSGGFYGQNKSSAAERTQKRFEQAGYPMPGIVWWNIMSRNGSTPVRKDAKGMTLVSGFSPSIMRNLLNEAVTPEAQMMETVGVERYMH